MAVRSGTILVLAAMLAPLPTTAQQPSPPPERRAVPPPREGAAAGGMLVPPPGAPPPGVASDPGILAPTPEPPERRMPLVLPPGGAESPTRPR